MNARLRRYLGLGFTLLLLIGGTVGAVAAFTVWNRHAISGWWVLLAAGVASAAAVHLWLGSPPKDIEDWVKAGRALGLKSIPTTRIPDAGLGLPLQLADALGRSHAGVELYLAHACDQDEIPVPGSGSGSLSWRERGSSMGDLTNLFDWLRGGSDGEVHVSDPFPVETFALFRNPAFALPAFDLRPEGVTTCLKEVLLNEQDIDFPADPKFSAGCQLRGAPEEAVAAWFDDELRSVLRHHPGWVLRGYGLWLYLARAGRVIEPDQLAEFLREADRLHDAFVARAAR